MWQLQNPKLSSLIRLVDVQPLNRAEASFMILVPPVGFLLWIAKVSRKNQEKKESPSKYFLPLTVSYCADFKMELMTGCRSMSKTVCLHASVQQVYVMYDTRVTYSIVHRYNMDPLVSVNCLSLTTKNNNSSVYF